MSRITPCKDCNFRREVCHIYCKVYEKWKKEEQIKNEEIFKNRLSDTRLGVTWTESTRERVKGRNYKKRGQK